MPIDHDDDPEAPLFPIAFGFDAQRLTRTQVAHYKTDLGEIAIRFVGAFDAGERRRELIEEAEQDLRRFETDPKGRLPVNAAADAAHLEDQWDAALKFDEFMGIDPTPVIEMAQERIEAAEIGNIERKGQALFRALESRKKPFRGREGGKYLDAMYDCVRALGADETVLLQGADQSTPEAVRQRIAGRLSKLNRGKGQGSPQPE